MAAVLAIAAAAAGPVRGQNASPDVTLDFTDNTWDIPTSYTMNENTYTSGDYTITLYSPNGGSNGYRFISNNPSYLILGQQNAYLELPAFSSPVEKIEVVGRKGASTQVHHNIYVGDVAVSTETIGDAINNQKDTTQTYVIDENYRAAGTHYRLKVTSSGHRTQITYIKVYFAPAPPTPHTVRLAEGTEDAANWTLASGNALVPGTQVLENVMSGSQVTATYNGTTKKVKSVKAVKYVAPVEPVAGLQTLIVAKGSTGLSGNKELYYMPGDTYRQALARTENQSTDGLGWGMWESASLTTVYFKEVSTKAWDMAIDGDSNFASGQGSSTITLDTPIDPTNHTFQFVDSQ